MQSTHAPAFAVVGWTAVACALIAGCTDLAEQGETLSDEPFVAATVCQAEIRLPNAPHAEPFIGSRADIVAGVVGAFGDRILPHSQTAVDAWTETWSTEQGRTRYRESVGATYHDGTSSPVLLPNGDFEVEYWADSGTWSQGDVETSISRLLGPLASSARFDSPYPAEDPRHGRELWGKQVWQGEELEGPAVTAYLDRGYVAIRPFRDVSRLRIDLADATARAEFQDQCQVAAAGLDFSNEDVYGPSLVLRNDTVAWAFTFRHWDEAKPQSWDSIVLIDARNGQLVEKSLAPLAT